MVRPQSKRRARGFPNGNGTRMPTPGGIDPVEWHDPRRSPCVR